MRLGTRVQRIVHTVVRAGRRHRPVVVIDPPRRAAPAPSERRFFEQHPDDPWPIRP